MPDTEAPELREPEEKPEPPVAPENREDPAPENLEELRRRRRRLEERRAEISLKMGELKVAGVN